MYTCTKHHVEEKLEGYRDIRKTEMSFLKGPCLFLCVSGGGGNKAGREVPLREHKWARNKRNGRIHACVKYDLLMRISRRNAFWDCPLRWF